MRAITKERVWDKEHKRFTRILYNAKKALGIREDLYTTISLLRQKANDNPEKRIVDKQRQKYLVIRKSEKQNHGYTINMPHDVIEKRLQTAVLVVLISNCVADAQRGLLIVTRM